MKPRTLVFAGVALLFVFLGALFGDWQTTPRPAQASAVDELFAQSMPDPMGGQQALAQWRGKTLVVNFWASWCAPCIEEMPDLSQLHRELSPKGTHVLGIGVDSAENIAQFAAKLAVEYPLVVGGIAANDLARRFGNRSGGLPFTVLIDPSGQVRQTYLGRLKMDVLRRDLAHL